MSLSFFITKILRIFEFFILALGPVLILVIGVIPKEFRFHVLGVTMALVLFATYQRFRKNMWHLKDFGLRIDNIKESFSVYVVCTTIGVSLIIFLAEKLQIQPRSWELVEVFELALLSIVVSVLQELLYRGYLIKLAEEIWASKWWIGITNVIFFTFLHAFYPNLAVILPVTFLGGILFFLIYTKYPNMILVSLMHIMLNFTALQLGFFTF